MRLLNYLAAVLAVLISHGCATAERYIPSAHAETPTQLAFALYATFDTVLARAASVAEDERTPDSVVETIAEASEVGVPASEAVLRAILGVEAVREAVNAGEAPPERVDAALQALEQEIARLRPVVSELIKAVTQ